MGLTTESFGRGRKHQDACIRGIYNCSAGWAHNHSNDGEYGETDEDDN